ncbi:hypothetical protein KO488_00745 [Poseidonibacter lekithochrous]|uniref:hypothetical protein n=1 Tax=Poseidonibacter TaxID=2321187 RepID=UPI001C099445|nr:MULTISPECIES: hypothetical protein [Poseidonibacter]MBU3013264.1 hypothetical protein [Poseidonibacter lekithochrous]MDO6826561.1 hypothetical protein [Poseidonibacter sp. 1_MG-2023]
MPKKTLEYAQEINDSKHKLYSGYDNLESFKLVLKKEEEFISLCEDVSKIEVFIT